MMLQFIKSNEDAKEKKKMEMQASNEIAPHKGFPHTNY